ncbi:MULTISPECIES: SAV_915 family protein [unclassified Streptomyces]|uniref:SAV_915 family protein n=1 Tax=unclassified Streptomyces TaxID=2593676 RepID=UPI002E2AC905|nr:SAV_915 family protein [Streptomyces sp. NBC_00223]
MHVSEEQPPGDPAPGPAGGGQRSLYVPVKQGPAGAVVRLWRTPFGTRTAVAFTSDRRLRSVLGPCQPWIRLSEHALRRMAEPLGATRLTIDPVLTARPPAAWSDPAPAEPCEFRPPQAPQTVKPPQAPKPPKPPQAAKSPKPAKPQAAGTTP